MKATISFISLICCGYLTFAQYIQNPSFENQTGAGLIPTHWFACHGFSTPDTQPGFWEVDNLPSHGSSYTNLIARGDLGPYRNTCEDICTRLVYTLQPQILYQFSIDLAMSNDWGHLDGANWVSYANPINIEIFVAEEACEKGNEIYVSPAVSDTNWETYSFTFTVSSPQDYLYITANWEGDTKYFGNILMDNIIITDIGEVVEDPKENSVIGCTVNEDAVPNIITPNADGLNDFLEVLILDSNVVVNSFEVFNRWGVLMYSASDVPVMWDAANAMDGIYYWHMSYSCLLGDNGDKNVIKGWVQVMK